MAEATTHKHSRVLTKTLKPNFVGAWNVAAEATTHKDYLGDGFQRFGEFAVQFAWAVCTGAQTEVYAAGDSILFWICRIGFCLCIFLVTIFYGLKSWVVAADGRLRWRAKCEGAQTEVHATESLGY